MNEERQRASRCHDAEVVLGDGQSTLRRVVEPLACFRKVLRDTLTALVQDAQIVLCMTVHGLSEDEAISLM